MITGLYATGFHTVHHTLQDDMSNALGTEVFKPQLPVTLTVVAVTRTRILWWRGTWRSNPT